MAGFRYNNFPRPEYADSPLFERQIGDDFAELQQCRALLEQQHQRILKLEKINMDLEGRLEEQAKISNAVEAECIAIERKWSTKCEALEEEIGQWKRECEKEKQRGGQLREQLSRTERELYVILQRSYELRRGGPSGPMTSVAGGGGGSLPVGGGHGGGLASQGLRASMEHGHLQANTSANATANTKGAHSMSSLYHIAEPTEPKRTRERKVLANLSDFLGF
eukprot:gene10785-7674_t